MNLDFGFNICGGSDKPPYIPGLLLLIVTIMIGLNSILGYRGIFVTFIKKDGLGMWGVYVKLFPAGCRDNLEKFLDFCRLPMPKE